MTLIPELEKKTKFRKELRLIKTNRKKIEIPVLNTACCQVQYDCGDSPMSEKLSWRIKNVDVNYSKISTIGKIWIFLLKESVMNSRSHLDQIYFSKQSLIHVPIKAFSIVTLDFI